MRRATNEQGTAGAQGSKLPAMGARGEGWLAGQVALIALVVGCGLVGPPWPGSVASAFVIGGAAVAVIGLSAMLAGALALGPSLTPLPKPAAASTLTERGIYARVRHPMYGGALVASIGWSLATSPVAFLPTAVAAVFVELKARREELWLTERHPQYRAYRLRVRWRFVPGIR